MLFVEDLLNGSFFKLVLMFLNWFMVFLNDFGGGGWGGDGDGPLLPLLVAETPHGKPAPCQISWLEAL